MRNSLHRLDSSHGFCRWPTFTMVMATGILILAQHRLMTRKQNDPVAPGVSARYPCTHFPNPFFTSSLLSFFLFPKKRDICVIDAAIPLPSGISIEEKPGDFPHTFMKAREPISIEIEPIPYGLRRWAAGAFLEALKASDAAKDHQHKLIPGVSDVVIPTVDSKVK
jgi:hypothetical protein